MQIWVIPQNERVRSKSDETESKNRVLLKNIFRKLYKFPSSFSHVSKICLNWKERRWIDSFAHRKKVGFTVDRCGTFFLSTNNLKKEVVHLLGILLPFSDGWWSKFSWIEREGYLTFHYLREPWNLLMTIFPIFRDYEWKKKMKNSPWFHVK